MKVQKSKLASALLHHHMIGEMPRTSFLHYWGTDPPPGRGGETGPRQHQEMKRAGRSKTSRELAAISSSFLKVRILQYTAAAPATAVAIAERLRRHGARADPAPVLVRMTHCGLLRAQAAPGSAQRGRQYSLTPTGRRLLAVARKHLQQLGAQQFTHGNTTHSTT